MERQPQKQLNNNNNGSGGGGSSIASASLMACYGLQRKLFLICTVIKCRQVLFILLNRSSLIGVLVCFFSFLIVAVVRACVWGKHGCVYLNDAQTDTHKHKPSSMDYASCGISFVLPHSLTNPYWMRRDAVNKF